MNCKEKTIKQLYSYYRKCCQKEGVDKKSIVWFRNKISTYKLDSVLKTKSMPMLLYSMSLAKIRYLATFQRDDELEKIKKTINILEKRLKDLIQPKQNN